MKKEVITIRKVVPSLSGVGKVVERIKDNGSVEEIRIRFYPGSQRTLKVEPFILHKGNKREDFFTYPLGTEKNITGDDDYLIFPVTVNFEYDDELVIQYDNIGDYAYTLSVDVIVSYVGEGGY